MSRYLRAGEESFDYSIPTGFPGVVVVVVGFGFGATQLALISVCVIGGRTFWHCSGGAGVWLSSAASSLSMSLWPQLCRRSICFGRQFGNTTLGWRTSTSRMMAQKIERLFQCKLAVGVMVAQFHSQLKHSNA